MKLSKIACLFFALLVASCSDSDEENKDPDPQPGDAGALINGTAFTPVENTATAGISGLEIKLTVDNDDYIILRLNSSAAGTYPVLDSSPNGRMQEEVAYVECTADGEIYYGIDGNVILIENADGTVSGEFEFSAENEDGDVADITEGTFENIEVSDPPAGVCRITKVEDDEYVQLFGYDGEGNLIYVAGEEEGDLDETFISYNPNGKPVRILDVFNESNTMESTITYGTNGLVSTITRVEYYEGSEYESSYEYDYDGNGRIVSRTTYYDGSDECIYEYVYAGDNLSEESEVCGDYTYTNTYSDYDSKNNPGLLFLQALVDQPALVEYLFDAFLLSANNHGEEYYDGYTSTYTYQYNSANYPTQITEEGDDYTEIASITYSGCN